VNITEIKETLDRLEALPPKKRQEIRDQAQQLADQTIDKFTDKLCQVMKEENMPRTDARALLETMFGDLNDEDDPKFERFYQLAFVGSIKVILDEDEKGANGEIPIQR
jgi:hypothetical protein